jgi:hypothetical protein
MTANPGQSKKARRKEGQSTKSEANKDILKPDMTKIIVLNFRVPAEFKRKFKIAAATHSATHSELLMQIFEEWQKKQT